MSGSTNHLCIYRGIYKAVEFNTRNYWSGILVAIINIILPTYFGQLINIINSSNSLSLKEYLNVITVPIKHLLYLYGLQAYLTFSHIFSLTKFGENLSSHIRIDLFSSLLEKDLQFHDQNKTGDLVTRLTTDLQDLKSALKQCLSITLKAGVTGLGTLYALYRISPDMTLGVMIITPSLVLVGAFLAQGLRKLSKTCRDKLSILAATSNEVLANVRTVKSFVGERREAENFEVLAREYADSCNQLGLGISLFQGLSNLTLNGLVLLTVSYGGTLLLLNPSPNSSSSLSAGVLMAFLMGVQSIQKCLAQLSTLTDKYSKLVSSKGRVFEHLTHHYSDIRALETEKEYHDGRIIPVDRFKGEIRFEEVTFAYPSNPGKKVLDRFSLTIRPCQVVAICGHNGSGKTTLVSLLQKFYENYEGRILIDGYDIRHLDSKWLRKFVIGIIDQDPILFSGSIMDNVKYGKPEATLEELKEAVGITKIDEFLQEPASLVRDAESELFQPYDVGKREAEIAFRERAKMVGVLEKIVTESKYPAFDFAAGPSLEKFFLL
ncbi:mitochondrial potassium channel ATP-binding subunit-like [Gordionus sp. m RMFG-2023]|uniref:mitochondrial potassium channel ATP-binding subunit-like n=1 Tax=Gordionus sp. m RMFG-2023 TaxID=3053472 RepID=UPI0031FE3202